MAAAAAYKWIHKFFSTHIHTQYFHCWSMKNFSFLFKTKKNERILTSRIEILYAKCSLWHHFFGHKFYAIFLSLHSTAAFFVFMYVCCTLHCVKLQSGIVSDAAAGGNWKQFFFSDGKINFSCLFFILLFLANKLIEYYCVSIHKFS